VPAAIAPVPVRAKIAEAILRTGVRRMPIRIELPDGRRWGAGGPDDPVMVIARPAALFRRIGSDANIGFGESYQAGDWSSTRLADVLTAFATHLNTAVPPPLQGLRVWAQRMRGRLESNTADVAQRNISAHYDLSNEMFATFLDPTMTYSSGWFGPPDDDGDADDDDGLTRAQLRKIDGVLDHAGVTAGSRVIEIGTGWGELSIRAALRGATVTSLTLSAEQKRLAEERVRAAGVDDRVTILLQDYREASGRYDAVISVEMIEAVGAEYWPAFFTTLAALLEPAGRLLPVHQDVIAPAHLTVKGLHQKALLPGEHLPEFVAFGQEVLGVDGAGGHRQGRGHLLQLHIQPVFVRQKVLETPETPGLNEMVDVRGNALAVLRVVEPQVDQPMALALEMVRKGAHGGEEGRHLLNVVRDVVGLLPDFHDDERHAVVRLREPRVGGVELVPQDQTQYLFALGHKNLLTSRNVCIEGADGFIFAAQGPGLSPTALPLDEVRQSSPDPTVTMPRYPSTVSRSPV
jgi:cyclopropane-fatty-acyl-phospholipid synthase